jgi:hypothetical protein
MQRVEMHGVPQAAVFDGLDPDRLDPAARDLMRDAWARLPGAGGTPARRGRRHAGAKGPAPQMNRWGWPDDHPPAGIVGQATCRNRPVSTS